MSNPQESGCNKYSHLYESISEKHIGSLICVVGARPNFMKIAPIIRAVNAFPGGVKTFLVHTGQHYDKKMKDTFFDQLGIPEPEIDLGVGSGSHACQTAEIMIRFEPVVDRVKPKAVLVVGDVNSTIACSLVAAKKGVPVIHVESGLRSNDRSMPEEINRILTDQLSDLLFTTERSAHINLEKEGIASHRIHFAGNVMIDTLYANLENAIPSADTIDRYCTTPMNATKDGYALLTMHRPSNVDNPAVLGLLANTIIEVSNKLPLIFTVHPRTMHTLKNSGLHDTLAAAPRLYMLPPLGYLEMLGLMKDARMILTDSGGLQEESTALGVPCITLRENTERPITVDEGTNTIVGADPVLIHRAVDEVLVNGGKSGRIPEYWDGKAAERISQYLQEWIGRRSA